MGIWSEVTKAVYKDLKVPALVGLLTNGPRGIHQLIAPASEGINFITYDVSYTGNVTKDTTGGFAVSVRVFSPSYKKSIEIADQVIVAITASENNYKMISGQPVFIAEDQYYIEQIFNIKI